MRLLPAAVLDLVATQSLASVSLSARILAKLLSRDTGPVTGLCPRSRHPPSACANKASLGPHMAWQQS